MPINQFTNLATAARAAARCCRQLRVFMCSMRSLAAASAALGSSRGRTLEEGLREEERARAAAAAMEAASLRKMFLRVDLGGWGWGL